MGRASKNNKSVVVVLITILILTIIVSVCAHTCYEKGRFCYSQDICSILHLLFKLLLLCHFQLHLFWQTT